MSADAEVIQESTAARLYELMKKSYTPFLDQFNHAYVRLPVTENGLSQRTLNLESPEFRALAMKNFYGRYNRPPAKDAVSTALEMLKADAINESKKRELSLRYDWSPELGGQIGIDQGDADWHVIVITKLGYRRMQNSSHYFVRYSQLGELPEPDPSGTLQDLKAYVGRFGLKNHADDILVMGALGQAMHPEIPKLIIESTGPKGSTKSTDSWAIKSLVDPSALDSQRLPSHLDDLTLSLVRSYMPSFDNVDHLSPSQADLFCQASTGGGSEKRKLYADTETVILQFKRACLVNGINPPTSREDYLDRHLPLRHRRLKKKERLEDSKVHASYLDLRPKVLHVLYTAATRSLGIVEQVREELEERKPRMADAAVWAEAFCQALGFPPLAFIERYETVLEDAQESALFGQPLYVLLTKVMEADTKLEGNARRLEIQPALLLHRLREVNDALQLFEKKDLPKDPTRLGGALRHLQADMEELGWTFDEEHSGLRRYSLTYDPTTKEQGESASIASERPNENGTASGPDAVDAGRLDAADARSPMSLGEGSP